jgi:membrane protease YdiL (CAAX protease family)
MACAIAIGSPDRFLAFPVEQPIRWLLVMALYPLLAAAPQEVIFRAFFFHRYGPLFPAPAILIWVNGLSFGLAHLLYGNWVAVALTTLGGLLFAHRYWRTGSLLVVSIEHGLWGDFLFTVGAGGYLYSGSIR